MDKFNQIRKLCINLERRQDRRNTIQSQFNKENLDVEFYNAVDGYALEPSLEIAKIFKFNDFNNRKGVIGCALSHYYIWKQLMNDTTFTAYLIFEDDARLQPNFKKNLLELLNNISFDDINMIYLGYLQYRDIIIDKDYKKPIQLKPFNGSWGTHCYIISKNFATELCNIIEKHGIKYPIDEFLIQYSTEEQIDMHYTIPILALAYNANGNKICDTDIQGNYDKLNLDQYNDVILEEYKIDKYTFHPNMDAIGTNINYVGPDMDTILDKALKTPECKAFDTNGYLKSNVKRMKKMKTYKFMGTYVKN